MDIFEKCYQYTDVKEAKERGVYPFFHVLNSAQDNEVLMYGKKTIMLGSNNYLGLTSDERIKEAAIEAIKKYGSGCSGSRFLNGTLDLHIKLEEKLASFLNKEAVIAFSTGFQANLGVISTIVSRNDYIISDRGNHASIVDGIRLSFGKVIKYNHNDMEDLERALKAVPEGHGKIIITDGVFSMEGDICNLPEIVRLKEKYNARVIVDDAHGIGVMGKTGKGTADYFNLTDKVDLIVGTFSKSLASLGGFVAGDEAVIDYIRHTSRPFIFSASITPASVMSAYRAIEILEQEPERVAKLWENANFMRKGYLDIGLEIGNSVTPIIPVMTYGDEETFIISKRLLDEGVYVNPVISPAVNKGEALLRTSYTATHTKDQLERALEIFKKVFEK